MADQKITELDEKATIDETDLLVIVDMAGSPVNKKVPASALTTNTLLTAVGAALIFG